MRMSYPSSDHAAASKFKRKKIQPYPKRHRKRPHIFSRISVSKIRPFKTLSILKIKMLLV